MELHRLQKEQNKRRVMNQDVIYRMRKGESLSSYNSFSSWFPPRPLVKKDKEAVTKLYTPARKNLLLNKRQKDFYPAPITYIGRDQNH